VLDRRRRLTDDAQSVDENTRGWTRGRAAIERYLSHLEASASDVHSQMRDVREAVWGDVGLVTFVLEQTYKMDGQARTISAPTSIVFRRHNERAPKLAYAPPRNRTLPGTPRIRRAGGLRRRSADGCGLGSPKRPI